MSVSVKLLLLTGGFVILGCILYINNSVGWAQLLWVLASGTAGGCVVAIMDDR
jgi:hypothetical protein